MTHQEQTSIRQAATRLQRSLWKKRKEIWSTPPDLEGLLPIPLDVVARVLLGVRLEEPEEIPAAHRTPEFETAGFIDRAEGRIVVAQKHRFEWRRFTLAHEIGHWLIHTGTNYHRDRTLNGGERANPCRPKCEQEADLFAAELLMPTKQLTRTFMERFGAQFDGRRPDPSVAFWLSTGTPFRVNEIDLSSNLRYRAMVISETNSFGTRHFTPLVKTFGVSPTAMAIQLEDLRLVI